MRIAADISTDDVTLENLLEGFTRESAHQWAQHPEWPSLYDSGVVYRREPKGRERWQTAAETMARKQGDCEDLANARAAELRVRHGERARVVTYRSGPGTKHAVVERANGSREDPSKILRRLEMERKGGMGHAQTRVRHVGEDTPPTASVKTRDDPAGDGKQAMIRFVTTDGHEVSVVAKGSDKLAAVARAVAVADRVINNPALAKIMPPQAKAALKVTKQVMQLAQNKELRAVAGKLKGPAKRLARMFS